MVLNDLQFFYVAVIGFAIVGFQRGWKRESISLGFALSGILFLNFGLGQVLAQFFLVRLPAIIQLAFSGTAHPSNVVIGPNDPRTIYTTLITFFVIVILGYIVGNRVFPKPTTPQERIIGVVPAVIAGFALVASFTTFLGNTVILTITTPGSNSVGQYVSIIFGIVIVALIIGLMATRLKKTTPKK